MRELSFNQKAEQSINKKYKSTLWTPFVKGVKTYKLIDKGDKIAVCISGGKDSMLLAKLMQQLHKHSDVPFEMIFLVMNPGYSKVNLDKIVSNAQLLQIPITIFDSDIFEVVTTIERSPCYLCARMRRGHLYAKAKELGCNKIALGHHFNDMIETTLMGMLYGAQIQTMMPKLHSKNFEGMQLVRPMYCVHEEDIISWKNHNGLEFIQCACRFTESCATSENGIGASKRQEVKALLKQLKRDNPNVEQHIFKSVHMVNLDTILGYKQNGREVSFLDGFQQKIHLEE